MRREAILSVLIALMIIMPLIPISIPSANALAIPVHLVAVTTSGTISQDFSNLTDALNYLNNTVGYDAYISASITIAPLSINENFTGCYVLHDLEITGSGASQTILYNESGTGMLCFKDSSNITISNLALEHMDEGIAAENIDSLRLSNIDVQYTGIGFEASNIGVFRAVNISMEDVGSIDTGISLKDVSQAILSNLLFNNVNTPIAASDIGILTIANVTVLGDIDSLGIGVKNSGTVSITGARFMGSYIDYPAIEVYNVENLLLQDIYATIYWWGIEIIEPQTSGEASMVLRNIWLDYCPESIHVENMMPGASITIENVTATVPEEYLGEEEGGLLYGLFLYGYLNDTRISDVHVNYAWWSIYLERAGSPAPSPWTTRPQASSTPATSRAVGGGIGAITLEGYVAGASIGRVEAYNSSIGIMVLGGSPEPPENPIPLYLSSVKVADNMLYDIYAAPMGSYEEPVPVANGVSLYPANVSVETNNVLISGETALLKIMEGDGNYWIGPYTPARETPLPEGLIDTGIRFEAGAYDGHVVIGIVYPVGLINSLGINEEDLTIYHFNTSSSEWEPLPTVVDTVHHIAFVTIENAGSPVVLVGPPMPAGVGGSLLQGSRMLPEALLLAATLVLGAVIVAVLNARRNAH